MNPYQQETVAGKVRPVSPDWHGLYAGQTSRDDVLCTKQSVTHPAKMSGPLAKKILDQMTAWGWLVPGSSIVVDPFSGTGLTALQWCSRHPDNRGVSCEIEPHFVQMEQENQAHAERKLGRALKWTALWGDSRRLDVLLSGDLSGTRALAEALREKAWQAWQADWSALAFQPLESYARAKGWGVAFQEWPDGGGQRVFTTETRRALRGTGEEVVAVTSPPYGYRSEPGRNHSAEREERRMPHGRLGASLTGASGAGYGYAEGQIGRLPDADAAAVTSPPYGQGVIAKTDVAKLRKLTQDPKSSLAGRDPNGAWFTALEAGYGNSPGNIDNLPDAAAVTSPPYESSVNAEQHGIDWTKAGPATGNRKRDKGCRHEETLQAQLAYAETVPGQIGTTQGPTYASACLEVYQALARAGVRYCAVVTKDPSRAGKLRKIGRLTCRLLRQAGYRVVAWRRAWLFENPAQEQARTGQQDLFGETAEVAPSKRLKGRLSFFRRLSLNRGSVASAWEDVFFAVLDPVPAALAAHGEAAVTSPPYGEAHKSELSGIARDGYALYEGERAQVGHRAYVKSATDGQIGNLPDREAP